MRNLTASQKSLLSKFISSQTNAEDSWERQISVFKGGKHSLSSEDLTPELGTRIEAINDSEILWQEVDRFMSDECNKAIYK